MNNTTCPNCGSDNTKLYVSTKDYFLSGDKFDIYECSNCQVLFTHPIPDLEILYSKYYKSDNYLSHNKKTSDLFSKLYRAVQKINIAEKANLIERINGQGKKKILEVGAGTGDFLSAMKKGGWESFGIEPSEQARQVARQHNNLELYPSLDRIKESNFSIITLWHVLEHIPDLRDTINKLRGQLSDNGYLIIAVPNYKSFDARHYKQYWAGYDVPRHLYHFNKRSLKSIMEPNGFELIKTKPMVFDSFYVSLLSEKYKRNNLIINYLFGFVIGLFSNISSILTRESSSIIFIFQKRGQRL